MREVGQKIANTFRTFVDKETVDYSGKAKKYTKTEIVKKSFEVKKKAVSKIFEKMKLKFYVCYVENIKNFIEK